MFMLIFQLIQQPILNDLTISKSNKFTTIGLIFYNVKLLNISYSFYKISLIFYLKIAYNTFNVTV